MGKLSAIISLTILLIVIASLFGLKVTWKPFTITLDTWKAGLAWLFFGISLGVLLSVREGEERKKGYTTGYTKGYKEGSDWIIEYVKQQVDSLIKDTSDKKVLLLPKTDETELTVTQASQTIDH